MPLQPILSPDDGVIASIGVVCNGDRMEIVFPLSTDDGGLNAATESFDATTSIQNNLIGPLQNIISADGYISFIQAEGMTPGSIPDRHDFTAITFPGNRAAGAAPSNVAALMVFYADPTDLAAGERMRTGKNFIPAIAANDITGDRIAVTLQGLIAVLGGIMLNGFATQAGGGNWYRVISPNPRTGHPTELVRSDAMIARGPVATQRRRLLPH